MDDDLVIAVEREDRDARITASGDLAAFTCQYISSAVTELLATGATHVGLDLTGVGYSTPPASNALSTASARSNRPTAISRPSR
jgi:hypothetical protein